MYQIACLNTFSCFRLFTMNSVIWLIALVVTFIQTIDSQTIEKGEPSYYNVLTDITLVWEHAQVKISRCFSHASLLCPSNLIR